MLPAPRFPAKGDHRAHRLAAPSCAAVIVTASSDTNARETQNLRDRDFDTWRSAVMHKIIAVGILFLVGVSDATLALEQGLPETGGHKMFKMNDIKSRVWLSHWQRNI